MLLRCFTFYSNTCQRYIVWVTKKVQNGWRHAPINTIQCTLPPMLMIELANFADHLGEVNSLTTRIRIEYANGEIQYAHIHQPGIDFRTMTNPELTTSSNKSRPPMELATTIFGVMHAINRNIAANPAPQLKRPNQYVMMYRAPSAKAQHSYQ